MCLILFSWRTHRHYALVLLANRDEFYARPTASAHFWSSPEGVLAGKDLEQGGTWLGVHRRGTFAALTNVREPSHVSGVSGPSGASDLSDLSDLSDPLATPRSRGRLPLDYLSGVKNPSTYAEELQEAGQDYRGFSLLVGDREGLWYCSNRFGKRPRMLSPGVYGLSNAELDAPWPKLLKGRRRFSVLMEKELEVGALFALMEDQGLAAEATLPRTSFSLEKERQHSAICIRTADYGTRSTTLLTLSYEGAVSFWEKTHSRLDAATSQVHEHFLIQKK